MGFKIFLKKLYCMITNLNMDNNKSVIENSDEPDESNYQTFNFNLAGVTFEDRQHIISSMNSNEKIYLKRDYNNKYDMNAIGVINSADKMIGWVPKRNSSEIAPLIDHGRILNAKINKIHGGNGYNYGINIIVNEEIPIDEVNPIEKECHNKTYHPIELANFYSFSEADQDIQVEYDFEDNEELMPDLYGRQIKEWMEKYKSIFLLHGKGYEYQIIKPINVEHFLSNKKDILNLLLDCVLFPSDFRVNNSDFKIKDVSEFYLFRYENYVKNSNSNNIYHVLDETLHCCVNHHLSGLSTEIQNLIKAIIDGNIDIINAHLNKFPTHINAQYLGIPLLHLAIKNNQYNVVQLFIEKGVDINQRSIFGDHAILLAAHITAQKIAINNFESFIEGKNAPKDFLKKNSFKKLIDGNVDFNHHINDEDTIWTFAIKYIKDRYILKELHELGVTIEESHVSIAEKHKNNIALNYITDEINRIRMQEEKKKRDAIKRVEYLEKERIRNAECLKADRIRKAKQRRYKYLSEKSAYFSYEMSNSERLEYQKLERERLEEERLEEIQMRKEAELDQYSDLYQDYDEDGRYIGPSSWN